MDCGGGGCEDYDEDGLEVDEEGLLSETACLLGDGDGRVREGDGDGRCAREEDEEGNRDDGGEEDCNEECDYEDFVQVSASDRNMRGRWRRTAMVNEDSLRDAAVASSDQRR